MTLVFPSAVATVDVIVFPKARKSSHFIVLSISCSQKSSTFLLYFLVFLSIHPTDCLLYRKSIEVDVC